MSRLALLLVTLAALALPGASAGNSLLLAPYPQRMADRYTVADGLPAAEVTRVAVAGGVIRAVTAAGNARLDGRRWVADAAPVPDPAADVPRDGLPGADRILSVARGPAGRLWAVTASGAFRRDGNRWLPFGPPRAYLTRQQPVDADLRPTCVALDDAGTVWLGSDVGLFATDGRDWWNVNDRTTGMPWEVTTCLAFSPNGDLWVGGTEGVSRLRDGEWAYFWGPRWLPGNHVNAIAVDADGAAWVACRGGVARLYERQITLEAKAAHYQEITDSRHNRGGYITGVRLRVPGRPEQGVVYHASDNDGLWTAVYVAAQSFRWAATKDPAARAAAVRSMRAMLDLVRLSGISGFPARAVIRKGEEVEGYDPDETVRVEGEKDRIWFQSPVDDQVLCKGDTSSDELDGHYFAWSVFHDFAATPEEKAEVRATVEAVTDHLIRNDLTLVGHTGRKTRWGVYHPRYINDDPLWWEERGLNALSILAYLRIAREIVGHPRYEAKARELMEEHHYLLNTVRQKVAEPWPRVNHSDDQMAFMMYYCILRYERDPSVRRVLLQSLERSWRIERPERSPFFNFVYGAVTGKRCDLEASVSELQGWPWELVEWETRGTHRHDVEVLRWSGLTRARAQLSRALPAAERRLMRWNGNPYQPDGGTPDGRSEEDGSAWLLPYWMGRAHGLIREAPAGGSDR